MTFPQLSRVRRHTNLFVRGQSILGSPQTRHRFPLGIEPQSILAVEIAHARSRDALFVAREAKHRERDRDGDVDSDLSGFEFLLEQGGGGTGSGEDCGTIAVGVGVDEGDGFVGSFDVEAHKHRAEDLFRVAFHVGFDVGDNGWSDL